MGCRRSGRLASFSSAGVFKQLCRAPGPSPCASLVACVSESGCAAEGRLMFTMTSGGARLRQRHRCRAQSRLAAVVPVMTCTARSDCGGGSGGGECTAGRAWMPAGEMMRGAMDRTEGFFGCVLQQRRAEPHRPESRQARLARSGHRQPATLPLLSTTTPTRLRLKRSSQPFTILQYRTWRPSSLPTCPTRLPPPTSWPRLARSSTAFRPTSRTRSDSPAPVSLRPRASSCVCLRTLSLRPSSSSPASSKAPRAAA